MPELAKRLYFICSPGLDRWLKVTLKENKLTYLHNNIKITIHLVRHTIMFKYTIETHQK